MLQDGLKLSHRCVFPNFGWSVSKVANMNCEENPHNALASDFFKIFKHDMNFQERNTVAFHTSNQKTAGCLDYIGDEILLSYMRIVIRQYKDPY